MEETKELKEPVGFWLDVLFKFLIVVACLAAGYVVVKFAIVTSLVDRC